MNKTTISIPKILISLIVYFTLPLSAAWLNQFVDSMTITYTLIFSAAALVLVSLNWDVFSLHLRRFTGNIKDGLLFTVICFIAIVLLQFASRFVLHPGPVELEREILLNYRALYEHYEADKHLIPEGHLAEVRFEEFEAHPLETAEALYRKLSLGDFGRVRPAMERYLEGQRGFRKKDYCFDLQTRLTVERYWGEALRQWDYRP